ncbi:hypothetical protein JXB28_01635 [Candidatus Woesearchaeota archaeon]|nr:hypothetical protein [Candidatus Woesearchaeota archaeon]
MRQKQILKVKSKRGVELGVNMIIISVIALLVLVVTVVLIQRAASQVVEEIPRIMEPAKALWKPTADDPMVIVPSDIVLNAGQSKSLALQVYNYVSDDVRCTLSFTKVGGIDDLDFMYSATNRDIPVDMVGEWKISLQTTKSTAPGAYMYTANINCGEFSKQEDLVVEIR